MIPQGISVAVSHLDQYECIFKTKCSSYRWQSRCCPPRFFLHCHSNPINLSICLSVSACLSIHPQWKSIPHFVVGNILQHYHNHLVHRQRWAKWTDNSFICAWLTSFKTLCLSRHLNHRWLTEFYSCHNPRFDSKLRYCMSINVHVLVLLGILMRALQTIHHV